MILCEDSRKYPVDAIITPEIHDAEKTCTYYPNIHIFMALPSDCPTVLHTDAHPFASSIVRAHPSVAISYKVIFN